MPTGYDDGKDPFTYFNGGNRKLIQRQQTLEREYRPEKVGKVRKSSLNLTDSIRVGDFATIDIDSHFKLQEPEIFEGPNSTFV